MSKTYHQEFATFAETGKGCSHGALTMRGDKVFSYDREIAALDRTHKLIIADVTKVSKTTTTHQKAVTMGVAMHLAAKGWRCVEMTNGRNPLVCIGLPSGF